jgi:hypothetical protein
MATTISDPQPSPEAKAVIEQDAKLRKWLRLDSADREFRPFWGEKPPTYPDPAKGRAVNKNWGQPFDLGALFAEVFGAVDTTLTSLGTEVKTPSPPKAGASPTSPEPPKGGGSTT